MSFDFKRRLDGLQEKMQKLDLDLAVYGSCQNFQYLTGLLIDWRHGVDLGSQVQHESEKSRSRLAGMRSERRLGLDFLFA